MDDDRTDHSPHQDADALIQALSGLSRNQAESECGALKAVDARRNERAMSDRIEELIDKSHAMIAGDFHAFARQAIHRMKEHLQEGGTDDLERRASELLYRAFDPLDEVLDIQYGRDDRMSAAPTTGERLYEGAGAGVQTSYTSILKTLRQLALKDRAHLIDLGSGYGRVGLVTGLWREDLRFTGYEYVGHRVESSRDSAERAGVSGRVSFFEQNLAASDFEIPCADAYYLFDPFSESTYAHVLRRLAEIGRARTVSVVTKADARAWFLKFVADAGWSEPERFDENTLMMCRSRPAV